MNNNISQELKAKKEEGYREDITQNPKVKTVYADVAKLMSTYRSGKLAKPFRAIPNLDSD